MHSYEESDTTTQLGMTLFKQRRSEGVCLRSRGWTGGKNRPRKYTSKRWMKLPYIYMILKETRTLYTAATFAFNRKLWRRAVTRLSENYYFLFRSQENNEIRTIFRYKRWMIVEGKCEYPAKTKRSDYGSKTHIYEALYIHWYRILIFTIQKHFPLFPFI